MNKRGSEKYYMMISLLLAIIVAGIVLYFFFSEYFNQDVIDRETCRQSVILRAGTPEITKMNFFDLREKFPLKCKAENIFIDTTDEDEALLEIANILESCHYLFGEGRMKIYGTNQISEETLCIPCARIKFSEKTKENIEELNIKQYLIDTDRVQEETFYNYLYEKNILGLKDPNQQEDLRKKINDEILSKGKISPSDGELLVLYEYKKSSYFGGGWWAIVTFTQPRTNEDWSEDCDGIDGIIA